MVKKLRPHVQIILHLVPALSFATIKMWDGSVSGNPWNHSENWLPSGIPGIYDTALFETIDPIQKTEFIIGLIAPSFAEALEFNNINKNTGYLLVGTNPLTLDSHSTNVSISVTNQTQSPNKINTAILLRKDLDIFNRSFQKITFDRSLSGENINITAYGNGDGTGVIEFSGPEHNMFSGNMTLHGGTLLLNKNPNISAMSGNLHIEEGNVVYVNSRQLPKTTSVYLHGSTGNATLDLGPYQENLSSLILTPSAFTNKVSIEKGGQLHIIGNKSDSLSLADHSLIEGEGSLILDGNQTGISYHGPLHDGRIEVAVDLNHQQRTVNTTAGSLIMSGPISNGGIVKKGAGTLVLTGDNTYDQGTLIQEGVLQGNSKSLSLDIQNNSLLVFDQNFNGTYKAKIDGSGSFLKTGPGTLTLSGENSFTGGVTIEGGSLEGTTLSIPGPIQNNGSLAFNQDFDGTFSHNIEGSGSFLKLGKGTVTLSGDNPFYGYIVISDGTLIGSTTSLRGHILNHSTVILDQSFDGIYPSTINGSGTFIKKGTGTLTLNQKNTLQGMMILSEGAIRAVHQESLGKALFQMEDNTTLHLMPGASQFNSIYLNTDDAFINVPSGSVDLKGSIYGGSFTKIGNGMLGLSGNVDVSNIDLSQGSLQIDGSLAASKQVHIRPNTALFGTGTINGDMHVEGLLTSGKINISQASLSDEEVAKHFSFDQLYDETVSAHSNDMYLVGNFASETITGNMKIGGNTTFSPESTIVIHFSPDSFSTIKIDGDLTLDSPTIQLIPSEGVYRLNRSYQILQAHSVKGQFGQILNTFPMIQPILSYNNQDGMFSIEFTLAKKYFADVFRSGNSGQVAKSLDHFGKTPCQNSPIVLEALMNISSDKNLKNALLQMHPALFTSLSVAQQNDLTYLRSAIYNRLQNEQSTCKVQPINLGNQKTDPLSESEEIVFDVDAPEKRPLRIWMTALGGYTNQTNEYEEPGYLAKSPGAFLGLDAEIHENGIVGGGLGYIYTDQEWKKDRGDAQIQNIYGSFFGQYATNRGYLIGNLSAGYSFYHVDRHISFGPRNLVSANARSNFQGFEGSIDLKMGLNYLFNGYSLSPFAGIDYMLVHLDSFEEDGARSLNLKVKSHLADLLLSEGGLEMAFCQRKDETFLKGFLRLSAILESRFIGKYEEASFVCGGSMKVKGLYPSRVLAGVGGGLSATFGHNVLSFTYQAKTEWQFTDQSLLLEYLWKF